LKSTKYSAKRHQWANIIVMLQGFFGGEGSGLSRSLAFFEKTEMTEEDGLCYDTYVIY